MGAARRHKTPGQGQRSLLQQKYEPESYVFVWVPCVPQVGLLEEI